MADLKTDAMNAAKAFEQHQLELRRKAERPKEREEGRRRRVFLEWATPVVHEKLHALGLDSPGRSWHIEYEYDEQHKIDCLAIKPDSPTSHVILRAYLPLGRVGTPVTRSDVLQTTIKVLAYVDRPYHQGGHSMEWVTVNSLEHLGQVLKSSDAIDMWVMSR